MRTNNKYIHQGRIEEGKGAIATGRQMFRIGKFVQVK